MKRLARVLVLLLVALGAVDGSAQAKSAPSNPAAGPLAPLAWMVGGTWVSEVKDPNDGTVTHVELRVHWSANQQALDFDVDFNGKPHYDGFYAYNPVAKTVNFYYTCSDGDLTIGTATPEIDGNTVQQEFDTMRPNGRMKHLRSTITRDGNDAYWMAVSMQKEGEWTQVFRIRYERK